LKQFQRFVAGQIYFEQRGKHELKGAWPAAAYPPIIQPSADPMNWWRVISCESLMDNEDDKSGDESNDELVLHERPLLQPGNFALPDVMIACSAMGWPTTFGAATTATVMLHCMATDTCAQSERLQERKTLLRAMTKA
jgi:hypothetical protein